MTALSAIGGKPRPKLVPPCRGPSRNPAHLPGWLEACSRADLGCCWAAWCCSALESGALFRFGRSPEVGRRRRLPCRKRRASASVLHWFSRARVLANLRRDRLNLGLFRLGLLHLGLFRRHVPPILHLIHSPPFWITRPTHQPTLGLQRRLRRLSLRMLWISRPWKN